MDISRDEASDQNAMTVEVKVRDDTNFEVFTAMLDLRTNGMAQKLDFRQIAVMFDVIATNREGRQ